MRNRGRCVGLAPLQGEKTQLRENTEGGCSREKFKSSCLERGRSRTSQSVRSRGKHPCPGCPIPTSAQCVFSLLGQVFRFTWDVFTFVAFLHARAGDSRLWVGTLHPTARAHGVASQCQNVPLGKRNLLSFSLRRPLLLHHLLCFNVALLGCGAGHGLP